MSREVHIARFGQHQGQCSVTLTTPSVGKDRLAIRTGLGSTEEKAIASALGRARLEFETSDDELEAIVAAQRGHAVTLMVSRTNLRTLGIR
jgi:hypothetical protein